MLFPSVLHSWLLLGPKICLNATPQSPHSALYAAFICGTQLPSGLVQELFKEAGLIHLLVVSGAHLVFVERLVSWLPKRARWASLLVYSWLTGFGIPIVRALLRRLCDHIFVNWGWTRLQTEAQTTAILLVLHPAWLHSQSFLMCWACALAMQAPWHWPKNWPQLSVSLKCYTFLFPLCPSSPLSIAWNSLVAPAMGEILFPACLLAYLFPITVPITDQVWYALLWLLKVGPRQTATGVVGSAILLWWLPLVTHAFLLWGEWKWRSSAAFSR